MNQLPPLMLMVSLSLRPYWQAMPNKAALSFPDPSHQRLNFADADFRTVSLS